MSEPLLVIISDLHFSVNTLELASESLVHALDTAAKLNVPLVIAGDLNDSKAVIRGEVANRLISILSKARVRVYIIPGNHDLLNERGFEHGLHFLKPFATIVDQLSFEEFNGNEVYFLSYQNNLEDLTDKLKLIKKE